MPDDSSNNIALGTGSALASIPAFQTANKVDRFLYNDIPAMRRGMLSPIGRNATDEVTRGRVREMTDTADRLLQFRHRNPAALAQARNTTALSMLRNMGSKQVSLPETKYLSDPNSSLWHILKGYGFDDKNVTHLGNVRNSGSRLGKGLTRDSMGWLWKHRGILKSLRPAIPVIPTALAGFGAYQLGQGFSKKMASAWGDKDNQAAGAGASVIGAAGLTNSGVRDLMNKNVLLTYGDADILGGGHKSTADAMTGIIDEIKAEDPRFSNMKLHKGPMDMGGMRLRNPALNSKRYLMSLDPGWGVTDDFRNERTFMREGWKNQDVYADKSDLIHLDHATGKTHGNKRLDRNIISKYIIQPDGMSSETGYKPSGAEGRTVPHGRTDYHHVWYGTADPYGDAGFGRGQSHFTGKLHPLVNMSDIPAPSSRDNYLRQVHDYMTTYSDGRPVPSLEELAKKKILTVSGASRGDTVGIRAKQLRDALVAAGKGDSSLVLGLGSGGMHRERLIAEGLQHQPGMFIGGRPGGPTGGPKDFIGLANNSDMHYMGLGGSTPPEMLAHGGSPIVIPKTEQVYYGRLPTSGVLGVRGDRAWLDESQGLHGAELKRMEELRSMASKLEGTNPLRKAIDALRPGEQRDWMNTVKHPQSGEILRRGLDGIREGLTQHGVHEVETADDVMRLFGDRQFTDKGRWLTSATTAREGLGESREAIKKIIQEGLHNARNTAVRRGSGKLLGAAGLLGLGANMWSKSRSQPKWYELGKRASFQSLKNQWDDSVDDYKEDSELEPVKDTAAIAGAGLLADTSSQLHKVAPSGQKMMNLVGSAVDNRKALLSDPTAGGKLMDEYSDLAQKLLRTRIMGVRASTIAQRVPFANAADVFKGGESPNIKDLLNFATGRNHKLSPVKYHKLNYGRQHYNMFAAGKGREAVINESVGGLPKRIGSAVYPHVEKIFSHPELKRFINLPEGGQLADHLAGLSGKQYDQTITKRIKELFLNDPGGYTPNEFFHSPNFNAEATKKTGPYLYGQAARQLKRFGTPLTGVAAAALAAVPALDLYKAQQSKGSRDIRRMFV